MRRPSFGKLLSRNLRKPKKGGLFEWYILHFIEYIQRDIFSLNICLVITAIDFIEDF